MCLSSNWISPLFTQIWVVFWVLCGITGQGVLLGFSSNLVAELRSPNSGIKIDLYTESWLLGCLGISAMVGVLLSTVLTHYFGRRWAYFFSLLPGSLGVILLYYGTSVSILMTARIFGGLTWGAVTVVGLIVIAEYTSPKHRGMFLNLKTAVLYLGCTIAHIMGNFMYWRTAAICFIVPHVLPLLSVLTWPESPIWLAYKEQYEECQKSFHLLRGIEEETELETIISTQKERIRKQPKRSTILRDLKGLINKLTKKDLLKPLFVNFLCSLLLESTGRHTFPSYGLQIIARVTDDHSNPFYYTLFIDLVMTLSATASSVLVKFMKTRTLLFISGVMTVIILLALCPYLYLVSENITSNKPWISILLMVLYFVTGNIGCVPIALGLTGETYPFEHRCLGIALTGIMISTCMTVLLKCTPYMILYLKIYGTLALLGGFMLISLVLLYYQLPETKDRTLQEIEHYFNHGRFGPDTIEGETEEKDKMIC